MYKLTGKPVALTIADCEAETHRNQEVHATALALQAAERNDFRRLGSAAF